jgi:hypothetical protein
MASTRSTTARRGAARAVSTDTPKAALTALARRTTPIQVAAATAAAKTLTGWAPRTAADHFDASLARAPIGN